MVEGNTTQRGHSPEGTTPSRMAPTSLCLLTYDQRNWVSHVVQKLKSPLQALELLTGSLVVMNN